jgi:flagellin
MGLRINQNIPAQNAYRNLSVNDGQMAKSLEKLSSGFRINRAADDAAGLAISEGLRSQIGGLKVAVRNTQDGISVVQTAEGALTETHSILQRMRDLSVQASNTGGLNEDAKGNIQSELGQLKEELTRIADTTKFSGANLLDGQYNGKFQVGANVGESINVSVAQGMSAADLDVADVQVSNVSAVWGGTASVASVTGGTAGDTKTLSINGGAAFVVQTVAVGGAAAALNETDLATAINAAVTAGTAGAGISAKVEGGKLIVTDSNHVGASTVTLANGTGTTSGTVTSVADATKAVAGLAADSDAAITAIDDAIKTVSTVRADLGAVQNRFDHTINNLNVAVENLSASESRIRDTDMAQEMVAFTRSQILTQAGTAMLAQANQAPQNVLQLLR